MLWLYVVWNLDRRADYELPFARLPLAMPEPSFGFLSDFEALEKDLEAGPPGSARDRHEKVLNRKVVKAG